MQIYEHIDNKVKQIKQKYAISDLSVLETIAKQEFGVSVVVQTPLVWMCSVCGIKYGTSYIFYNAEFEKYRYITLSHEIGHFAAGHLSKRKRADDELVADYFAARLNNISLKQLRAYRNLDAMLIVKSVAKYVKNNKKEIDRLKKSGVYYLLK